MFREGTLQYSFRLSVRGKRCHGVQSVMKCVPALNNDPGAGNCTAGVSVKVFQWYVVLFRLLCRVSGGSV